MKLQQCITKPSVTTTVVFTKTDVIEALKQYAESKGYVFMNDHKLNVWYPYTFSDCDEEVRLQTDDIPGFDLPVIQNNQKGIT